MRTPEETLAQLDVIEGEAAQRRNVGKYGTTFEQFAAERDVPDLVALVRKQRDEITYLHTVVQGIAHYTRCSEELPCLRCQRDAANLAAEEALHKRSLAEAEMLEMRDRAQNAETERAIMRQRLDWRGISSMRIRSDVEEKS